MLGSNYKKGANYQLSQEKMETFSVLDSHSKKISNSLIFMVFPWGNAKSSDNGQDIEYWLKIVRIRCKFNVFLTSCVTACEIQWYNTCVCNSSLMLRTPCSLRLCEHFWNVYSWTRESTKSRDLEVFHFRNPALLKSPLNECLDIKDMFKPPFFENIIKKGSKIR